MREARLPVRWRTSIASAGMACGLALLSAGYSAQAQQTPSVDQILDRYVAALGGPDALRKVSSRHAEGQLEFPGQPGTGTAESFAKAPNKYVASISFPGLGQTTRGFDGLKGWIRDDSGVRDLTGSELSSLARLADMYQALDLKKQYPNLVVKGTESVYGKPVYVLEGAPSDGTVRRMYFEQGSGLLVRNEEDTAVKDPDNPAAESQRVTLTTEIQDYREVDGVRYPFLLIQHNGPSVITIRLSKIQQNVPIDDAHFARPQQ